MAGRESTRMSMAMATKLRCQKDLSRSRVELASNSRRMAVQSSTGSSWRGGRAISDAGRVISRAKLSCG